MGAGNVRFSVEIVPRDPLWRTCIYAMMVDRLGFDTIWLSDHFFNRNVFLTTAVIAKWTSRCLLGPAVVNPYVIHPAIIAQSIATLEEIAPKRLIMAIGAGDETSLARLCIKRENPVDRVRESIHAIRRLLAGEELTSHDSILCFSSAKLETKTAGDVPIYVGAQGKRMLIMSASHADGVLINWTDLDRLSEAIKTIKPIISSRKGFDIGAHLIISIHEDIAKARKTAIPFAAYLMAGSNNALLSEIGVSDEERNLVRRLLISGDWDRLYSVARDEWIRVFSFYGTMVELRDFIDELLNQGFTHIVFGGPWGPRPRSALLSIAKLVSELKPNMGRD